MSHRTQTLPEEKVNAITHGLGVVFAVIATPILLEKASKNAAFDIRLGILMFSLGMLAVYLSSTLYHATRASKLKNRLHICDHVSIFFLIGGSYVPFVQAYTDDTTAQLFLAAQWTVIVIGAILKLFFTGRYEKFSLFTYIFLGWSAFFLFIPFMANMPFPI